MKKKFIFLIIAVISLILILNCLENKNINNLSIKNEICQNTTKKSQIKINGDTNNENIFKSVSDIYLESDDSLNTYIYSLNNKSTYITNGINPNITTEYNQSEYISFRLVMWFSEYININTFYGFNAVLPITDNSDIPYYTITRANGIDSNNNFFSTQLNITKATENSVMGEFSGSEFVSIFSTTDIQVNLITISFRLEASVVPDASENEIIQSLTYGINLSGNTANNYYNNGYNNGYNSGYNNGYSAGYSDGLNVEQTVAEEFFDTALSILKTSITLIGTFLGTKIVGDMSIGLFVIGIPSVFLILNGIVNLIRTLLFQGGKKDE